MTNILRFFNGCKGGRSDKGDPIRTAVRDYDTVGVGVKCLLIVSGSSSFTPFRETPVIENKSESSVHLRLVQYATVAIDVDSCSDETV